MSFKSDMESTTDPDLDPSDQGFGAVVDPPSAPTSGYLLLFLFLIVFFIILIKKNINNFHEFFKFFP